MSYTVNGRAEIADTSLRQARGVIGRLGANPSVSMVRESSLTLVSGLRTKRVGVGDQPPGAVVFEALDGAVLATITAKSHCN